MTVPTHSVVIPAYNAPRTIRSSIASVLRQTRTDMELIVVDDGSTDDTPAVVADYERRDSRVRLIRQANQGVGGARNTGIANARGGFVSFLDNDDLWLPRYLELMGEALRAEPGAGFAHTDGWTLEDATKQVWKESTMATFDPPERSLQADDLLVRLLRANFVLTSATVRRSVLEEVGGFDAELSGVDEYDLWLRIAAAGYSSAWVPGRLVIMRNHPDSQSKDEMLMVGGLQELLRRRVADESLPEEARSEAARQLRRWDLHSEALLEGGWRSRALRVRRAAGRAKRGLGFGPAMHKELPPEVVEAFPDLREM